MGKHKNIAQDKIFVEFMECHQDIARGYVKGDKVVTESLWAELTVELNNCGPPSKQSSEWKKTWCDWKTNVKRKLLHNVKENKKTGGGAYNQHVLTDIEESICRMCGFYKTVAGVRSAKSFGNTEDAVENDGSDNRNEEIVELPSTSNRDELRTPFTPIRDNTHSPAAKRPRLLTPSNTNLNSLLSEENQSLQNISKVLEEQCSHIKAQNQKLDRLCDILENKCKADQLHQLNIEKKLCEKNELKLKIIEIEETKLQMEVQKSKVHKL